MIYAKGRYTSHMPTIQSLLRESDSQDEEKFMELLTDLDEVLNDAEFVRDLPAIKHLKHAETVETVDDFIANVEKALGVSTKKSMAQKYQKLLAKAERLKGKS